MATVMYIPEHRQNRFAMHAVINYCQQEYKTYDNKSKRQLISGVNCDGANAFREFMATKNIYNKANGFFFYHYAQSFSPKEKITPEQAHEIALEFAEKAWSGHEVLVVTHCDREHIHSHFVINSVGFESGKKLRQSPSTLKQLRKLSDEICIAHGFSVLQPYQGGKNSMSSREYRARLKGNSWKEKLANDIDKAMEFSGSKDEFIRNMSILGYHMTRISPFIAQTKRNAATTSSVMTSILKKTSRVNCIKESSPVAKSNQQVGRLCASCTSNTSETVPKPRLKCKR